MNPLGRLHDRFRRPSTAAAPEAPDLAARVEAIERRLEGRLGANFSAGLLLGKDTTLGNRLLYPVAFQTLTAQIAEVTGASDVDRRLKVAYRSLFEGEARSVGRVAGSTSNVLGKLVTSSLLAPQGTDVLEIGTLFGVFAGLLVRELSRSGEVPHLTVLDPLEGVQLQTDHTMSGDVSGTPVTESVVRANLRSAGLEDAAFRIIKGFSGDVGPRKAANDRTYGLVVVDGDHSYDGVLADLEWVEEIAAPGSVVVLDDYGDAAWPGVEEATRHHLASSDTRFVQRGVVATSAYLVAG